MMCTKWTHIGLVMSVCLSAWFNSRTTGWSTKMAVFWVVALCSLVEVYQRFIALMTEAARSSETLVNFC
jgi:hypothetical protein